MVEVVGDAMVLLKAAAVMVASDTMEVEVEVD
jgi:hypothetical protein